MIMIMDMRSYMWSYLQLMAPALTLVVPALCGHQPNPMNNWVAVLPSRCESETS